MVDPEPERILIEGDGLHLEALLSKHGARARHRARGPKGEALIVDIVPIATLDEAMREAISGLFSSLRATTRHDETIASVVRLGGIVASDASASIHLACAALTGETLAEHLATRRRSGIPGCSLQQAVAMLQPIAHALDRLHARDQAHLLLSPEAIVLEGDTPRLVDHGVAALLSLASLPKERTREHAAPEQVDPSLGHPSPFSDVFSLALIFMELLLGASVFSSIDSSQYYVRLVDRARRPALRDHGIGVSPSIDRVLGRALAVDPRSRFSRAGAFWEALAEAVRAAPTMHALNPTPTPRPIAASKPEPKAPPARGIMRGRESQILGAAAIVGMAVFGVETLWRSRSRASDGNTATGSTRKDRGVALGSAASSSSSNEAKALPAPISSAKAIEQAIDPAARVDVARGTVHFLIDKTEVTVAAYRACIAAGACTSTREHGYGWNEDDPLRKFYWCNLHVAGRDRHPINCVTWNQANSFCSFVGERLPREREWELAAQGETKRRFPWGRETPTCARAVFARYGKDQWGCKDEPVGTAEVDAHPDSASPFGALDLAGNLWEWTADRDGSIAPLRGGGFDSSESNLTTTSRIEQAIFNGDVNVGFRCIKDP